MRVLALVALALLPALAGACPSLEDPMGPVQFAPIQAFGVLLAFAMLQDLVRRIRLCRAGLRSADPFLFLDVLFLAVLSSMLFVIVGLGEGWDGSVHPAFAFNLAFTGASLMAAWGTALVGIPVVLFRWTCGRIRCHLAGGAEPPRSTTFVYRRLKA